MVRTVCGDVPADTLGLVNAHDHLMITGGPATVATPELLLDNEDDARAEAGAFRARGGGSIVEMTPIGAGRDVRSLERISRASGVHIICVSGFHAPEYYDRLHFVRRGDEDLLVRLLEADIAGADSSDYWEPFREPTKIRPGAVKVATDYNRLTALHEKLIAVVGQVAKAAGLPVITHTGHGTMAAKQLKSLQSAGLPANRIAFSHMDRNPDLGLHEELVREGATLIYDGCGREKYYPVSTIAELYRALDAKGLAGRILFGGDNATQPTRLSKGGFGIVGMLTQFTAGMERNGCARDSLQKSLGRSAQKFLGLSPPTA